MRKLGAGIAGGILAGAFVGGIEAVVAAVSRAGGATVPPLGWAVAVYGLAGALGGLVVGIVATVLRTGAFGLALGGIAGGLGFVVGRFRIVHDVFHEQAPHGVLPTVVELAALLACGAGGVLVWRALRGADERQGALTRPGIVALAIAVIGIGWMLVARVPGAGSRASLPPASTAAAGSPNVLLIVVDSLRADHLSCYGYGAVQSPHIDALAADGIRFAHAFAQASWTRASIGTILSGLYPSSHGAIREGDVLPDRVETIAEALAKGGYDTVGFPNDVDVSEAFGFGQGFAEYHYLAPDRFFFADEAAGGLALYDGLRLLRERFLARHRSVDSYYRPAETVVARVRAWLDGASAKRTPFFLYVHFMDPHDPYMVHPFDGVGYARAAMPVPAPAMADTLRRAYDGEIVYLDEHIGSMVADLKRRGLYDDMLIVLTADHGEELHEHGGWWHGTTLYDEQIGVPLIVKPPRGGAAGTVVDELATSLDVAPTILRRVGLPPPIAMQGHVLPLDGAPAPAREDVFAEEDFEGNVLQAVRSKTWKFVTANPGNPRGLAPEELYDLARDPKENRNVSGERAGDRELMRAALGRASIRAKERAGGGAPAEVDRATKDRLKALGYAE